MATKSENKVCKRLEVHSIRKKYPLTGQNSAVLRQTTGFTRMHQKHEITK